MKALVTGASGFVGSMLVQELEACGIEVAALLRRTSSKANLEGLKYTIIEGSLFDTGSLERAMKGVDMVFHVAGVTTALDDDGFIKNNATGTRNVAEAAAKAGNELKRLVYVSSLAAGGPASAERPRTESDESTPVSTYGRSKLQGELELLKFKSVYPVTIVRPPIVYGPRDKGVFLLIKTLSRGIMPLMRGAPPDGGKYYSTVHAADLARAITSAGTIPGISSGEIFYVCSDKTTSYEHLLDSAASAMELKPLKFGIPMPLVAVSAYAASALARITRKPGALNMDKLNELEPDFWTCSNEKAKNRLGFKPEFEIESGMKDTIAWYRGHGWLK